VSIIGIDADQEECARLSAQPSKGIHVRYLPYAIGREDGASEVLHITRQPGCSSLLKPNDAFLAPFPYRSAFDVINTLPVTVTTLDSVCRINNIQPDVIKIDTQGTELDVLRGGDKALETTCLVELEVEFNPIYVGQPLFADVDNHLRQRGFALLGLRRDYWRRDFKADVSLGGTIIHGDALFYRVDVPPERLTQFALALAAYRQVDFLSSLGVSVPIGVKHASPTQRLVGRLLSAFREHRRLRGWLDESRPAGAVDWHDPDFF
jgi:FkbM family methyltransferase